MILSLNGRARLERHRRWDGNSGEGDTIERDTWTNLNRRMQRIYQTIMNPLYTSTSACPLQENSVLKSI